MHPYIAELFIAERVRERDEILTAPQFGRPSLQRFLPRRRRLRMTWKTRAV